MRHKKDENTKNENALKIQILVPITQGKMLEFSRNSTKRLCNIFRNAQILIHDH